MSLQFVLGNSGSGKSRYMYEQLVNEAKENPKKNYLVVVPEQFTMQTQRELVDLAPNHAIMNIDVVSFPRLAYRVFDELGRKDLTVLEETGKNLILRKIAQQKEKELTVLRPNLNRMGYISEIKSLLSECMQYHVTPEQLEQFIDMEKGTSLFMAKLRDVITMYRGFEDYMRGQYITAEGVLPLLCSEVEKSVIIRESVIVFDEFTGFTPVQMQLLEKLLVLTDRVQIALSIDAGEDFVKSRGIHELFYMPKKTIHALLRVCEEKRVTVLDPVVLSEGARFRYRKAPSLYFMEQNLFRTSYKRKCGTVDEIGIDCLKNPKDELILVARRIAALVRKGGLRYQDIAVVTGDMDTYGGYVEEIFRKYKLPFFMDQTRDILFHPFIECIRAALEVIMTDFSYTAVFRFLRCGFLDIPVEEIDKLENYVLAVGIRGQSAWKKRFLKTPRENRQMDLEVLNETRECFYEAILPLAEQGKDATAGELIKGLYAMIAGIHAEQKLEKRKNAYMEAGDQTKAKEYEQIYRIVMELFEKIYDLLGAEQFKLREFSEILDAGLDAAKVAVIPPGYDSVTIGDIERTRLNHIKVLFFIGVNDGIIPKAGTKGGIISEYERQLLKEAEVELAPGPREQVFIQKYYLYLNMTKPSEKLYLSYAKTDHEGKAIRPSYLIGVVKRMFPDKTVTEWDEMSHLFDGSTPRAAFDYLIHGKHDEAWFALAKWFLHTGEAKEQEKIWEILSASYFHYTDEPISRAVAWAVYGRTLEGSVTRLERFAACAYAHFLQYGLRLREREESGFRGMDIGNLYHEALQRYSIKLAASEYDWFTVPEEEQKRLSKEALEEAVAGYPALSVYTTAEDRHQLIRMQHILEQTVWALTKQVRKGRFVPSAFELSFSQEESLDAVEFSLNGDEQMKLTGRIDRLDLCRQDDGRVLVKVIDYKSGNTSFDLVKIYQGLQLQLVIYMNAAMEIERKEYPERELVPGAVFYYHIDDPVIEADGELTEEEYKAALLKALRPDGLVNREEEVYRALDDEFEEKSDVIPVQLTKKGAIHERNSKVADTAEFELIERYVRAKIEQCGKAIFDGKVTVDPYVAASGMEASCTYCPYAAVCGLDLKLPGYQIRTLAPVAKDEVFDRMETELALQEKKKS